VGFESSQVARRRLAAAAMRDRRVQEALVVGGAPPLSPVLAIDTAAAPTMIASLLDAPAWGAPQAGPAETGLADVDLADVGLADVGLAEVGTADGPSLALVLDDLAVDILDTPGAGGALIEAFAEQSRVLRLVVEALERAPERPLPAPVADAVRRVVTGETRAVTTS
jgi:hypothetical protein